MQMLDIAQIYVNDKAIEIRLPVREPQVRDIGLLLADQGAEAAQHARIVRDRRVKADREHRRMPPRLPAQVDPARGLVLEFLQRRAVDGMDDDAMAAIGDAHDPFARNRLAAGCAGEALVGGQAQHRAQAEMAAAEVINAQRNEAYDPEGEQEDLIYPGDDWPPPQEWMDAH